jgi:hypothetical protein
VPLGYYDDYIGTVSQKKVYFHLQVLLRGVQSKEQKASVSQFLAVVHDCCNDLPDERPDAATIVELIKQMEKE